MGRIVTPKVHVEVFRPTYVVPLTDTGNETSLKPNFSLKPNELTYIRVTDIEEKRIKGIQFEETALFGGFIEINIAEDPTSDLFDQFSPNDHVEVFYEDTTSKSDSFFKFKFNKENDLISSAPKFQGATWKTDLKYRPTMVTTQLHAWDYLRLLQYVNIPRGKKQPGIGTVVKRVQTEKGKTGFQVKKQREQYGDNLLDYIDSALDTFTSKNEVSIFGENVIPVESTNTDSTRTIKFGKTYNKNQTENSRPKLQLYTAGIGEHCHDRIRYGSQFKEVQFANGDTWSRRNLHKLTSQEDIVNNISEVMSKMGLYDMLVFRFLDGEFERFAGVPDATTGTAVYDSVGHIVAEIVVISQFALMELLVKKITYDHGINEWFTPIINLDPQLTKSLEDVGDEIGQRVSKLVYIRLRKVKGLNEETTELAFNMDTFPFMSEATEEIFIRAIGNLKNNAKEKFAKNFTDIFLEAISSTDFPQQKPDTGNKFSLESLASSMTAAQEVKNQAKAYEGLLKRFRAAIPDDAFFTTFRGSSKPYFFQAVYKRTFQYATLIQKILQKDNKLISFIGSIPASFMRADIYTGSKFNTMQYDSLAITRIIQILTSTMAGFPLTNNPKSNTKTGIIDSYPIFAANRIIIKPKAYFAARVDNENTNVFEYEAYRSLSLAATKGTILNKAKFGNKNQVKATCFLVLDVARKRLKDKDEKPEFILPMEHIQDFGMIKASTVNHYFNFSLSDYFKNIKFADSFTDGRSKQIFENVIDNGFFIQYRENGQQMAGFSPPEHQHLTLADLVQDGEYDAWSIRSFVNGNVDGDANSSKPIVHPLNAFSSTFSDDTLNTQSDSKTRVDFIINNYDDFKPLEVYWDASNTSSTGLNRRDNDAPLEETGIELSPFHGVTHYLDITDLITEYKTLNTILQNEDLSYKGINNVGVELMKNIFIRSPLSLKIDLSSGVKYDKRITIKGARGGAKLRDYKDIKTIVSEIVKELDKLTEVDMHWLFPYRGYNINKDDGKIFRPENPITDDQSNNAVAKHFYVILYLDLLVKGIRYILWSIAKARFFAHIYIPIDYQEYAQNKLGYKKDDILLEPGSSIQITYEEDNTLNKSVEAPLVGFKIKGLGETKFRPLTKSIARKTSSIDKFINIDSEKARQLTWYVSKKVTYLGADVGAMMRIEMTEGSLDWTLFYNEKNLLTQISEHYFLNGLGNFRAGGRV